VVIIVKNLVVRERAMEAMAAPAVKAEQPVNQRSLERKTASSQRGWWGGTSLVRTVCLLLMATSLHGFKPADRAMLKTTVEAWCTDSAAATSSYGDINSWDVSLVTDMSYLLGQYTSSSNTQSFCQITSTATSATGSRQESLLESPLLNPPASRRASRQVVPHQLLVTGLGHPLANPHCSY